MNELAKRLVACKRFRWMPGVRWLMLRAEGTLLGSGRVPDGPALFFNSEGRLPDLNDPGTIGCLLALVRKAWDDPLICVAVDNTGCGWWVNGRNVPMTLYGSEAEALVATLEAAP